MIEFCVILMSIVKPLKSIHFKGRQAAIKKRRRQVPLESVQEEQQFAPLVTEKGENLPSGM